jgi:hypothetical protein
MCYWTVRWPSVSSRLKTYECTYLRLCTLELTSLGVVIFVRFTNSNHELWTLSTYILPTTIVIAFSFGTNGFRLVLLLRRYYYYLIANPRPMDHLQPRTCLSTLPHPCSMINRATIKYCACKPCTQGNPLQTRPKSSST